MSDTPNKEDELRVYLCKKYTKPYEGMRSDLRAKIDEMVDLMNPFIASRDQQTYKNLEKGFQKSLAMMKEHYESEKQRIALDARLEQAELTHKQAQRLTRLDEDDTAELVRALRLRLATLNQERNKD